MASTIAEYKAPTSQTLTFKLFALGSDTEVSSTASTEQTNRKETYLSTVTFAAIGVHHWIAVDASGFPFASGYIDMLDDTSTHRGEDSYAAANMRFTKAFELDVNTQSINGAGVTGDGNATGWDGV